MSIAFQALESAIKEVSQARARINKVKSVQVRNADDVDMMSATAQAWFYTHRPVVVSEAPNADLAEVDEHYTTVLNAATKHASRHTYLSALKDTKVALIGVRASIISAHPLVASHGTDDLAPDFSPLAGNVQMRDILTLRWHECLKCVSVEAHLAAIVMMGGMLEALFVARANALPDKAVLITSSLAPKDKDTGKTLDYQKWMLDSYIKVGKELKWITESAMAVADVLKDYRNFIHPAKQLRYRLILDSNDSSLFWQVTKSLTRQLLLSVSKP